MIQSMFPPIKVQSMNLSTCKRVVLFNIKSEEGADVESTELDKKSPII